MDPRLISTSKFLSLVLRHRPETTGVELDDAGWVDLTDLVEGAQRHGKRLTHELVIEVVHTNDKQRFALSDDGRRIRANQGHSIAIDLELTPTPPPPQLFHGTAERNLSKIMDQGLLQMNRHHVHLSADWKTAEIVGKRHGTPVVLRVDAQAMANDGFQFYMSRNGVWLTLAVPPSYLVASQ